MPEIWEIESEYDKAVKLLNEGKYKEAKEIFIKYVDQNPHDQHAWEKLEECFLGLYKNFLREREIETAMGFMLAAMNCLGQAMISSIRRRYLRNL